MRISTTQIYTEANRNMMEGQTRLAEIQSKLASGKNFTTLAEDPVGANQVVNLKRELAQFDVFQTNIDATRRRLELEETTLDQLNTAVTRAQELLIQASNGVLTDADRNSISYELDELTRYAASLMNTRDAKGEYIFSGSKGTTQTYRLNGDGSYTYQGDDTRRQIQVGSSQYLDSTDTGQFLFEAVKGEPGLVVLGQAENELLASGVNIEDISITDADAFEAYMRQTGDIRVSVTEGLDPSGPTTRMYYSVLNSAGDPIADASGNSLEFIAYDPLNPAELSLTLPIDGATLTIDLPNSLTSAASGDLNDPVFAVTGDPDTGDIQDYFAVGPTLNEPDTENFAYQYITNNGPFTVAVQYDGSGPNGYSYSITNSADPAIVVDNDVLGGTPAIPPGDGDLTDATVVLGDWSVEMIGGTEPYTVEFTIEMEPAQEVTLRYDQPKSNILSTLVDTVDVLRSLTTTDNTQRLELRERLTSAQAALGEVQERLSQSVAGIGSRLNTMEKAEFSNLDFKLLTESTLSAVEDLDYASASTELAKRQLALQAAYASFAKVQGLSLFNYIN